MREASTEIRPGSLDPSADTTRWSGFKASIHHHRREVLKAATSTLVILAGWEFLARAGVVAEIVLPRASDVAVSFVDLVTADYFMAHLRETATATVSGFLIGSLAGILLGIVIAVVPRSRAYIYPHVVAFQVVPKVVLAPIFVIWFGFGMTSKVVTTASIVFFPVVVNTILGLESVEDDARDLMRSLSSSRWQTFKKLSWPTALPAIFAGLEVASTLALIGTIVAEFVRTDKGLGLLVETYSFQLRMDYVFAVVIVISLLGLVLFGLVKLVGSRIIFWRRDTSRSATLGF